MFVCVCVYSSSAWRGGGSGVRREEITSTQTWHHQCAGSGRPLGYIPPRPAGELGSDSTAASSIDNFIVYYYYLNRNNLSGFKASECSSVWSVFSITFLTSLCLCVFAVGSSRLQITLFKISLCVLPEPWSLDSIIIAARKIPPYPVLAAYNLKP